MGSCTSWAHVYYSFTYAINKSRGVKTTPENTYSPQWSYNLTSNGESEGSTAADIEWFLEKQGGAPLSMVPYKEDPVTWCSDMNVWRESINNRLTDTIKYNSFGTRTTQITSPSDPKLTEVKTALAKGEILTFSTEIYSWVTTKLKSHKDAPGNDAYVGEEAVKYLDGAEGSHAMTIVGYNDNIWVDVNDNGKVDSGEMGAFKIANSWGKGYHNDGFIWFAYDAVNLYSSVAGFDGPEHRNMGMRSIEGVVTRPYGDGTDIYIRYNFTAGNRRENSITIIAEKDGTEYTYKAYFPLLTLIMGEAKIPYDGNMLVALDNVIPDISAENFYDYNWSVAFTDRYNDDKETTYRNAEIVIESTNQVIKPKDAYPITLNGETETVEFSESKLNHAVVYYRGFAEPLISYSIDGSWRENLLMGSNTEREGYVYKYVIDLGNKASADIYFADSKGNKDNNGGKNYTIKKGINYFVTEGVAEPVEVKLTADAEKTIEFDVLNKAVIFYRGFYNPVLNYTTADGSLTQIPMEPCFDEQGFVNKAVIDLGDSERAELYFTDEKGNKDDNGGENYTVKAGKNYFVTQGVAEALSVQLEAENVSELNTEVTFKALVAGGYAPYTYLYSVENKLTGEKVYSQSSQDLSEFSKTFEAEGLYEVVVYVTDFAGTNVQAKAEINIITPTEAPTTEVTETTEATEVTEPSESSTASVDETEVTETVSETASQNPATHPTEIVEEVVGIIGDANADGKVNIKDATVIQKHIAKMETEVELDTQIADCFEDGKINIKDATLIQKFLAKYETERVGEELIKYTVVTLPVPTVSATTATADETEIATAEITTTAIATEPQTTTAVTVPETTVPPVTTQVVTTEATESATEEITTVPPTEIVTEPETEPTVVPQVRTVTFTNSHRWSGEIKCYYWSDENTTMTAWPGVPMQSAGTNDFGEDLYIFDVPEGVTYIIFTNGSSQTVDITFEGEAKYYPTTLTNDKGHFLVEMW